MQDARLSEMELSLIAVGLRHSRLRHANFKHFESYQIEATQPSAPHGPSGSFGLLEEERNNRGAGERVQVLG